MLRNGWWIAAAVLVISGMGCKAESRCPKLSAYLLAPEGQIPFPASPFAGGLSIPSFGVALGVERKELPFIIDTTTTLADQPTPHGQATVTTIIAHAGRVDRETTILALDSSAGTFLVRHRYTFEEETTIDGSTAFHALLRDPGDVRLFYGPADGTDYMEDYFALPVPDGYSKRGSMTNGGTPVSYLWGRDGGIAVGVLTGEPGTYELPVQVSEGETVLAARYVPDGRLLQKRTFAAGEVFETDLVFVSYHRGDFFGPLERYTRLLEPLVGRTIRDAPVQPWMRLPYWKTWGFSTESGGSAFTKAQVRSILPELEYLGISWVVLDYGWFVTEGNWAPSGEVFEGQSDLQAFVDELKGRGFRVGLWYQPVQLDYGSDEIDAQLRDRVVLTEDGDPFIDDDDLALLDPSLPVVQQDVDAQFARFEAMGIDAVYLDSQMAQLASPPNFGALDPLASHRALPALYTRIRERAAATVTTAGGIAIEICPDGRSQSILNMPQDVTNVGDPKDDRALRAELKSLKAIQGPRSIVGAYVDPYGEDNPVSGSFLNIVGLGGKLETFFIDFDLLGRETFLSWMDFYRTEDVVSGAYLDLYDIGFDYPEGHVVEKDSTRYYSFFTHTEGLTAGVRCGLVAVEDPKPRDYTGPITLKGLIPGRDHSVIRHPGGEPIVVTADGAGEAILQTVSFSKEILFLVRPIP